MGTATVRFGTALVLTVVGLVVTAPARADAATGCVSESEYDAVHVGQTESHVHQVFGTTGRRLSKTKTVERRVYDICNVPGAHVRVTYTVRKDGAWKLRAKDADAA